MVCVLTLTATMFAQGGGGTSGKSSTKKVGDLTRNDSVVTSLDPAKEYADELFESAKTYADSKEYTREVYKSVEYFVVTNPPIDVHDATITNSFNEAFQGMAFDLYFTNSIYFIDENNVPTLKFFAPKRRRAYFGNRFSCVEIGDFWQVFKTYNQQVDNMLAVKDPSRIRFMDTLDRNSAYGEGRSMTLQDYLDAFNPVFVPETIRLFQTNHSNYSIGNLTGYGSFELRGPTASNTFFSVSTDSANFMNSVTIRPVFESGYDMMTNNVGQITNIVDYVISNSNVEVAGNVAVSKALVADKIAAKTMFEVYDFDSIVARVMGYGVDANGNVFCIPGSDNVTGGGLRLTLPKYIDLKVSPLVTATNEYYAGDKVIPVDQLTWPSIKGAPANPRSNSDICLEMAKNRMEYLYDAALVDVHNFNILGHGGGWTATITNFYVYLPDPAAYTNGEYKAGSNMKVSFTFDLSGVSHGVWFNIGTYNFAGLDETGKWETILANEEPNIATESVLRSETRTFYDYVYDDNIGDWVEDLEHPREETYEWYDEYQTDMNWYIEPYTCKEFRFKQVGPKTMRVEINTLYKTNPGTLH
jgi:hypothetical protein